MLMSPSQNAPQLVRRSHYSRVCEIEIDPDNYLIKNCQLGSILQNYLRNATGEISKLNRLTVEMRA